MVFWREKSPCPKFSGFKFFSTAISRPNISFFTIPKTYKVECRATQALNKREGRIRCHWAVSILCSTVFFPMQDRSTVQSQKKLIVLLKGLLNVHLGSPQSKFQISNYHLPYRKFGFF
jgi:hypothetical protein